MKRISLLVFYLMIAVLGLADNVVSASDDGLTVIVMDPLAKPLSCPCVEGYAQRDYNVLAKFLEKELGERVNLVFADALGTALKGDAKGQADVIIGKDSVIRFDAAEHKFTVTAVARLTDKDGLTTQNGLVVVASSDPAKKVADLSGYRILFGPKECDEKHAAAMALLKKAKIAIPAKLEIDQSCSDGAAKVVELAADKKTRIAAVISSYAAPLLEGCGTIKKGDLQVVGKTKPVPFVTAFTTNTVDAPRRERIQKALLAVGDHRQICEAIETLIGFVPIEPADEKTSTASAKKK
ncbi:ABC transporter, phosphonate, periplasmic substrate-binding protein [Symmachiella dynata]|uniref:PhnD/SsuA/transferrin family substrate-binding protein n=1 Tax=Symmachiella dynata TaxID=2527995 RepID=UPI00118B4A06|nr:PhnD/SsuA/transferrin family substrate-binding protein [Symmachiella dynata]QDT47257.1 ABC transporter, phosphonate, periplasmic substrate-binding protein [Symmachiella dynata]